MIAAPLFVWALPLFAVLDITDGELQAVLAGKVPVRSESHNRPDGKPVGRAWGAIVVERPVADVWATLIRYEDRPDYVPRLRSVMVLERRGDLLRVRQEIDAALITARYTAWYHLDEHTHTIRWQLDKSARDNTLADLEGDYRMAALSPNRTVLVYRTAVDPGRGVPKFIQSYMQRRSVPDLLQAIKRRVESGGTWRKRGSAT